MGIAPNHFTVVQEVFDNFKAEGKEIASHAGLREFSQRVVLALNKKDSNWGHLRKYGAQTQIDGRAEDSALYKGGNAPHQSVDFVAAANSPSANPSWNPDTPRYADKDWADPTLPEFAVKDNSNTGSTGGTGNTEPKVIIKEVVIVKPLPSRNELRDELAYLHGFYRDGLKRPEGIWINGAPDFEGIAAWFLDTYINARLQGKSPEEARKLYVDAIMQSEEWHQKH